MEIVTTDLILPELLLPAACALVVTSACPAEIARDTPSGKDRRESK